MHHILYSKISSFVRKGFLLLYFVSACITACAQDISLNGKIASENGEPVPGATVTIKGISAGTATNDRGEFTLPPVKKDAILIITCIGYEKQELPLNGKSLSAGQAGNLVITLKRKTGELDQAIVIAYGTTTKRLNTGDVSKVTAEEMERQPVSNPLAALEGRVPGLVVTQNTGVPGGGFGVRLRGQNSIANGNDPLYLIDGVPYTSTSLASRYTSGVISGGSPFSGLNPADIESIEVLKDADATSIYGSRGANGVILITTKKGKAGKTKVDVNVYQGTGKITRTMKLLNTQQYLELRHEAFKNDGATPDPSIDYDLLVWDTTRYTDWQKLLIGGTSYITDAQASISGGNTNTQFLASGGYHKETTVFAGSFNDQKAMAHFNLTHSSANQKFKFLLSTSYTAENNILPQADLTYTAANLPPDAPPVFDAKGQLNWESGTWDNPYGALQQQYKVKTASLIGNTVLSYHILPDLLITTSAGFTGINMNEVYTTPAGSYNPAYGVTTGTALFPHANQTTWIIEPQFDWHKQVIGGQLDILGGVTFQQDLKQGQTPYASGFTNDALIENIAAAGRILILNANYTQYRYNALFGRINYNWHEKYLINLTARRDGSSRFGPGKQFANFGAVGAGWIFSNENYFKNNISFLSFGKLRVSYGSTGNDQIADYGYLGTYSPSIYPYQGHAGLYPTRLFNTDYGWEINKKLEAGLELGFLSDRILVTSAYYNNRSSNQLLGYPLPPTTGFTSIQNNLPAIVQNTGTEFDLNTVNLKRKSFSWTTSLNVTFPTNKLIAYPGFASSAYANLYAVGQSLYIKKGYHYTGVNEQTGVLQFEDVDKDGTISYPNDLKILKTVSQQFYGGFSNTLRYKNWTLNVFIQFVKQTGYNYATGGFFTQPGFLGNQPEIVLKRWQKPGDKANIQRATQDYGSEAFTAYSNAVYYISDYTITDASYIRLKNLYLAYQAPDRWLSKTPFTLAKFYLACQNLLTITPYQGMDPENNGTYELPPLKIISAGIQFTL